MNLIKIGDKIINLDQVTDVNLDARSEPGTVRILAANGGTDFKGEEAAALRHYFTQRSDDVMAEYQLHLSQQVA